MQSKGYLLTDIIISLVVFTSLISATTFSLSTYNSYVSIQKTLLKEWLRFEFNLKQHHYSTLKGRRQGIKHSPYTLIKTPLDGYTFYVLY